LVGANVFDADFTDNITEKKVIVSKKRFGGFMFENAIYWDNPGLQIPDRETWLLWKNKGLIK